MQRIGASKEINFENWLALGLGKIAINDGGTYNTETGAGTGSDYLYTKYTYKDRKKYDKISKFKIENIEVSTNLPQVDMNKIYKFLALWKNETGEIDNTVYKSNGIKVKYKDIYGHQTEVANLFVSAPEFLFELLEQSESTRELVDIFKYIMYIYTGTDYGISSDLQISFVFGTNSYTGGDYIVHTTMSSNELVLTKEQLIEAIENTYSGECETILLNCVDDYIYIQLHNRVNPVFAIAVAIQETMGGIDWSTIDSSTFNLYGVKGEYNGNSVNGFRQYNNFSESTKDFGNYIQNENFVNGNYTVTAISNIYANQEWGTDIIAEMNKIYNSIGIAGVTGGVEGTIGNITTITVGTKTYKNYKQIEEEYKSIPLACFEDTTTLYQSGCAITSDAIIASAYRSDVNPVYVNQLGRADHQNIIRSLTGLNWVLISGHENFNKQDILNQLRMGNPVVCRVNGDGGFFRSSSHYFAILSISEDGNSIYVSDPASRKSSRNGWMKADILDASGYYQYIKRSD